MFFDVKTILRGRKRRNFDSIEIVLKFPFFWCAYCHISSSRIFKIDQFQKIDFFDFGRISSNFLEVFVRPHNSKQLSFIWNHFYSDWSNLRWDFVLASFEIFKNKNRIITWHLNVTWPHIRFLWTIFDPLSDETEILNIRRLFGFLRF